MKNTGNAEGTSDTALDARAAHQPWMGALVSMTPQAENFAGDFWLTSARAPISRPQPSERIWDSVLALVFVAACAALGWASAFLL